MSVPHLRPAGGDPPTGDRVLRGKKPRPRVHSAKPVPRKAPPPELSAARRGRRPSFRLLRSILFRLVILLRTEPEKFQRAAGPCRRWHGFALPSPAVWRHWEK